MFWPVVLLFATYQLLIQMEDFKQQNVEHLIGLSVGLDSQVPPGTGSLCVLGWWGGW